MAHLFVAQFTSALFIALHLNLTSPALSGYLEIIIYYALY